MRMRFKPYARPELLACDFHVHEPLTHGGHWHELYARPDQPWHWSWAAARAAFWHRLPPPTSTSTIWASTSPTRC